MWHICMQAFLVYQVLAGGEECEPIPGEEWKTQNYTRTYVCLMYKEIGTVCRPDLVPLYRRQPHTYPMPPVTPL